jgi:hypothetical protein
VLFSIYHQKNKKVKYEQFISQNKAEQDIHITQLASLESRYSLTEGKLGPLVNWQLLLKMRLQNGRRNMNQLLCRPKLL